MIQIDEPIFKQVDGILNELINVACNYEKGKDVDLDAKANETNHALQALIVTQVEQARGCVDCKKLRCENCERLWQT